MRRLALISDIHGNLTALDAVLADVSAAGFATSGLYCLGDLVGYGPDPRGVIDRIRSLGIPTIRGNYDAGIGERRGECGCHYATDQARADGAASYTFTDRAVDDERGAWLAALPHELRLAAGELRILLAHGSPRKDNEYLLPDRSDAQLARLADAAAADVVCIGHVHIPYHRTITGADGRTAHYVSAGSVGKPKDGDPRACWTGLVVDDDGTVSSTFHRVAYDIEGVAGAMRRAGLPETLVMALRTA